MRKEEKLLLTSLNKIDEFGKIIKKLTVNENLKNEEKSFILGCAIICLKEFKSDKRFLSLFEFAYYIILKYSVHYEDYLPLYDISLNFGFYPISREIINHNLLESLSLNDALIDLSIDKYKKDNYLETLEQKNIRSQFIEDTSDSLSFLAPTSFGKSSAVIEHIKKQNMNQVAIIVPTKSLLVQTYRTVKKAIKDRRIILHDEMYNDDERFIAIFTQERALRLLEKFKDISFDILYIDEAHNLFEKDSRSILLSRLIRMNIKRNPTQRVVYLSPLVNLSENLLVEEQKKISELRIFHNIKEPEMYEYRLSGDFLQYNRFVNQFYKIGYKENLYDYILDKKRDKNFVYIRNPRKIENFAKQLMNYIEFLPESEKINDIIFELESYVHHDFYVIKMLKKGIIYIHGKMPDIVKEYLEFKFKSTNEVNFIVANSVILEGINLPIDSLFILNTYRLNGRELTNLIGRVNRLDTVFNKKINNLNKLLPQIHFVNSAEYNSEKHLMKSKIELLRNNFFADEVNNPNLKSFDIEKELPDKIEKINNLIENENIAISDKLDKLGEFKKYLINADIYPIYKFDQANLKSLFEYIEVLRNNIEEWLELNIIDKIFYVFVANSQDYITDYEISRLEFDEARNFYKMYIKNKQRYSLKKNIEETFKYFKARKQSSNSYFYIGETYGEVEKLSEKYDGRARKVYVDISKKSDADLINLVIVKLKLEDDFISYKLNKFVIALYDLDLIKQEEYNQIIYGTNDTRKISLIKTGLSINLITKLQDDEQLKNLNFDHNNNLIGNEIFIKYKNSLQGFYKFELDKYL